MLPNPTKLYLELAAVLAAVALILFGVHRIRESGREEVRAANAAVIAAAVVHNAEVEARAKVLTDQSLARYKDSRGAAPPSDALSVRVCKPASAHPLPKDDGPRPPPSTAGELPGGVEDARDIGPGTEQILERANAKVRVLQEYILTCQDEGFCAK